MLNCFFKQMKSSYTRQQLRNMADDTTVKDEANCAYIKVVEVARSGKTEYMYEVKPRGWGSLQKIVDTLKIYFPDSDVSLHCSNFIRIAW